MAHDTHHLSYLSVLFLKKYIYITLKKLRYCNICACLLKKQQLKQQKIVDKKKYTSYYKYKLQYVNFFRVGKVPAYLPISIFILVIF